MSFFQKCIILFLIFLSAQCIAQKTDYPFYEQIAFDFYKTTILDSFPVKKKIKVYKYAFEFHPSLIWFDTPTCFPDMTLNNDEKFKQFEPYENELLEFDSGKQELDFSTLDKKQFKVKKNGNGNHPKLFISPPYIINDDVTQIFINLYEKYSDEKQIIYHLKFNPAGDLLKWCRTENEIHYEY